MEYQGTLYGKVAGKYLPLVQTTEDIELMRHNIEQLRVQLAGCGVAAMCNTEQSREQQKCVEGDYGWSQSYQDVVDAVGREIVLRRQFDELKYELDMTYSENERLKTIEISYRELEKQFIKKCAVTP